MIQDLGDLTKSAGLLVEYDRGTRGLVFLKVCWLNMTGGLEGLSF